MIVFLGIAGSGKTTQAKILAKRLGCPRVSAGELLRTHTSGEESSLLMSGKLVNDNKLLPLIAAEIKRYLGQEFILDGSPRTLRQAKWLSAKAQRGEIGLTAVIHLNATETSVRQRLLKRGRPDDHDSAIRERFAEYMNSVVPILNFLREKDFPVYEIDGEQSEKSVADDIVKVIGLKQ